MIAMALGFALCFAVSKQIYLFLLHPFAIAAQLLAADQAAHAHQAGGFDPAPSGYATPPSRPSSSRKPSAT